MSFLDELCDRLGVSYRFATLPEGCRAYLIDGVAVISDNLTPEQAHWSYCHEVAHLKLNHYENLPRDDSEEREQETEANHLAVEMLLPESQFKPEVHKSLCALKELYPFASYEVLARRRLAFRPGLLTIYDNERRTARIAPDGWNVPAHLFPVEMEAFKACLESKGEIALLREDMRVEATYVDEGRGVVRVILFAEAETG